MELKYGISSRTEMVLMRSKRDDPHWDGAAFPEQMMGAAISFPLSGTVC